MAPDSHIKSPILRIIRYALKAKHTNTFPGLILVPGELQVSYENFQNRTPVESPSCYPCPLHPLQLVLCYEDEFGMMSPVSKGEERRCVNWLTGNQDNRGQW